VETEATVVSVNGEGVEVEAASDGGGCGKCHTSGGCGGGRTILGTRIGAGSRLLVAADLDVSPGDRVVVGLPEGGYLRASLAIYLAPLAGMFIAAGLAEWLGGRMGLADTADVLTLVAGLVGLGAGFFWQRGFGRRFAADPRYRPRLLRRSAKEPPASVGDSPTPFRSRELKI